MAAYRPEVTRISRYKRDISELLGETAIVEVQKHGMTSANTLLRHGDEYIKDGGLYPKWMWNNI